MMNVDVWCLIFPVWYDILNDLNLFLEVKCIKILMMSHELKSFLICFNNAGVFSIFVHLN